MAGAPGTPPRGHRAPAAHTQAGAQPDTHPGGCPRHSRALPSPVGTACVCGSKGTWAHVCRSGGTGPRRPLGLPVLLLPRLQPGAWVTWGVPGPAEMSPSRGAPTAALPAPHRAVMNGSGGSSGTRAAESVCAIDFSSTAAESGARAGTAAGTPASWHGEGSHVPTPRGHVPHAAPLSPSPPAQPGHPGDSARTGDPPAAPWDARHSRSGPDVGLPPPVPCPYLPASTCMAATSPSTVVGTGGGRAGAARGMWGTGAPGCPPASPPRHCGHTHATSRFLPATVTVCCGSVPWGCVMATGLVQGRMRGAPGSRCPTQLCPRVWGHQQGHGPHSAPWCGEGAGIGSPLSSPARRGHRDVEQRGRSLA